MLPLEASQVHLWLADQDALFNSGQKKLWLDWLTEAEMARYQRFFYDRHKHSYLLTRAVSRSILSLYTDDVLPEQWQFSHNDYGKPHISAPPLPEPLYFNISHSANKLVMAVSRHDALGVDVESAGKNRATLQIGRRYFSEPEYQGLCLQPAQRVNDRFYDLWTLKEAYIKACGMGLAISLQQFSFELSGAGRIAISFAEGFDDDPALWQFWQFATQSEYKLAVALKSAPKISASNIVVRQLNSLTRFREFTLPVSAC